MKQHAKSISQKLIGDWALESLLFEVALFPKPGLVDPKSNGAHDDMNYMTFLRSCNALAPFLIDYVALGLNHDGTAIQLFKKVRLHGQQAEKTMLEHTNGINTHKGANFSFALLLSAVGKIIQTQHCSFPFSVEETTTIFEYVKAMTAELLETDFTLLERKKTLSYGEKLYLNYGITGIRGEAAAGYPTLQKIALPFLRTQMITDLDTTFLLLLLQLMATVEDANLINRGGIDAWQSVQKYARKLLSAYPEAPSHTKFINALTTFDQHLIEEHLSPGGSADLLALSYFFAKLEGLI